jgi:MoxR-like ATPase
VLCHRLLLTPEAGIQGHTTAGIVESILAAVPVPAYVPAG